MESCVVKELQALGYTVNDKPYAMINIANKWYQNEIIDDFHKRTTMQGEEYTIDRMGFAKLGCEDDANLCEVININIGNRKDPKDDDNEIISKETKAVRQILDSNKFDTQYREQLERMSATGTVGAYIYLKDAIYLDNGQVTGGNVRINYCRAENIIPLTVVNGKTIEAGFSGTNVVAGKQETTLVVFRLLNGKYRADTFTYDENGNPISKSWIQLGDKKPFEIMKVAQVNNYKYMDGFGLPKVYKAIPVLKQLDLCNMIFNGDLSKGEKLLLASETLMPLDDQTGKPKQTSLMKKIFVLLGKDLPESKDMVQEYNPTIRVDEITKSFELCLSFFSMMFGFGTKQYKFENGQVTTATEYIGERQDKYSELNKQRKSSDDYIKGLCTAIMWFENTFNEKNYDLDAEIKIDYDDSYIEDKNTKLEEMRNDATTFNDIPEFTIRYIQERFNVSRKEAIKIYNTKEVEEDPEPTD